MNNSNDWDNIPKPWTIEQCRDRYVMGDRIGLKALANLSGVPIDTIRRACQRERWVTDRSEFKYGTSAKVADLVSSQIAEGAAKIFASHYSAELEVFEVGRDLVSLIKGHVQSLLDRMEEIEDADPEEGEPPKKINAYEMQAAASALNTAQNAISSAIDGQRKALGLDYSDINYAVSSVRRAGLEVVDADEFKAFKSHFEDLAKNQSPEIVGDAVVVDVL